VGLKGDVAPMLSKLCWGGGGRSDNLVTGCTVVPDHQHAQQGTFTSGTSNQSLSHNHGIGVVGVNGASGTAAAGGQNVVNSSNITSIATLSADLTGHNHNVTISGQTSNVNVGAGATNAIGTWQPLYAKVIICSKD